MLLLSRLADYLLLLSTDTFRSVTWRLKQNRACTTSLRERRRWIIRLHICRSRPDCNVAGPQHNEPNLRDLQYSKPPAIERLSSSMRRRSGLCRPELVDQRH